MNAATVAETDQAKETRRQMAILTQLLQAVRLRFSKESELQDDIETVFREMGFPYEREFRIGRGAIDFRLVSGLGVECKTDGSASSILPQLQRYNESPELTGLLLVTSRPFHRFDTATLCGKPFAVCWIGASGV